ncbi:MAG: site-specific integrase, partial [bacterium]
MLNRYFVRPETVDRVQTSWIGGAIEQYVEWLTEHRYAPRNVFHRVPILRRFGDFARARGATAWAELPDHVEAFVEAWVGGHRGRLGREVRNPIQQMLRLVAPGVSARAPQEPFAERAG